MATPATTAAQRTEPQKRSAVQWIWEARTKGGELKKGGGEAQDADGVRARLRALGLVPEKVRKRPSEIRIKLPGFGGVTGKDLLVFTRQFATMIDAGLPLVPCLDILCSQMDNAGFQKVGVS